MSESNDSGRINARKSALALAAVAAVVVALVLVVSALFPYFYAESGSARYAREHRGEAMLQLLGAAILLIFAWLCIRRSFSARSWMIVVGLLLAAGAHTFMRSYVRVPANVQPVGGNFHVVTVPQPGEIDTVFYTLYYKRGPHYERIAGLVGEYRFVGPECMTWRGLKVVGRPMLAMCGYRKPVETYDTTTAESELLSKARSSPSY